MSVAVAQNFPDSHYNPVIGRFVQKDPILFNGGDTNFYRYAGNDPINDIDPSGRSRFPTWKDIKRRFNQVKDAVNTIRDRLTCKILGDECNKDSKNADDNVYDYIDEKVNEKDEDSIEGHLACPLPTTFNLGF